MCVGVYLKERGGRKKERERGREGGRERSLMCLCLSEREREQCGEERKERELNGHCTLCEAPCVCV